MSSSATDKVVFVAHKHLKSTVDEALQVVQQQRLLEYNDTVGQVERTILQLRTFVDASAADSPQVNELIDEALSQARLLTEQKKGMGVVVSAVERLRAAWRTYIINKRSGGQPQ